MSDTIQLKVRTEIDDGVGPSSATTRVDEDGLIVVTLNSNPDEWLLMVLHPQVLADYLTRKETRRAAMQSWTERGFGPRKRPPKRQD